jgi:DNA-nicking Smr family endonuclease
VAGRRLDAEERALWRKVTAGVRPLEATGESPVAPSALDVPITLSFRSPPSRPIPAKQAARSSADTLDGGWDRRLKRGMVIPDRSIDLHGHTLAGAHAALEAELDRAIADDVRVLLVVTGRLRPGTERRGLIRAAIGDWLGASRHAGRIAAVRTAHPRHGGGGALYLILRRRRS